MKQWRSLGVMLGVLVVFLALPCPSWGGLPEAAPRILIDRSSSVGPSLLERGNTLFREGNWKEALECFLQGPAGDPAFALWTGLTYWKMNQFHLAGPYLRQAKTAFAARSDLQTALHEVIEAEIDDLQDRLAKTSAEGEKRLLWQNLGQRFEESLRYVDAAKAYERGLAVSPDYFSLVKVGSMFRQAGDYRKAAGYFLTAARISTDPKFCYMWAMDCQILAGDKEQMQAALAELRRVHSGPDLEWYQARLYRLRGDKEPARQMFVRLGAWYERQARKRKNRQENLLNAAQAYLDGDEPFRAMEILNTLAASPRPPMTAIDTMKAGYYFREKRFDDAIDIYRGYPDAVEMQVSLGWALYHSGKTDEARDHFQALRKRFPEHPAVMGGWRAIANMRPWNVFYGYSAFDYGDYQKERELHSTMARYQWGRVACALGYTSTTTNAGPDDYDFTEDLIGWRYYRRANDVGGVQAHGLLFQNTDPQTDGGWVLGGKYYQFGSPRFHWDTELNFSHYPQLNGVQTTLGGKFLLTDTLSTSLKLEGGYLGGDDAIWAETRTPIGFRLGVAYQDHNAIIALEGQAGDRILMVDSDGLYAYNSLDTYREGASLMILEKAPALEFYLKVGGTRITSMSLRARNERTEIPVDTSYHAKFGTIGVIYRFF